MDAEIVAIDANGNILPFQELSNRARKDVKLSEIKVLVAVYAFDLMYLDGEVSSFSLFDRCNFTYPRPPFTESSWAIFSYEKVLASDSFPLYGVRGSRCRTILSC
jgi:hypothetical protein